MPEGHREKRKEVRHKVLATLREHLTDQASTALAIRDLHPADVADVLWLDFPPEDSRRLFLAMEPIQAAEVLSEAETPLVNALVTDIPAETLAAVLNEMQSDDAADVLEILTGEAKDAVLKLLEPEHAQDLQHLGAYPTDTAGGLMTTDYLDCLPQDKVGDVLKRIKRDEGEAETIHNLYVVNHRGVLVGVVSTRELLEAGIHQELREIMNTDVIKSRVEDDQEEVSHRILHYNLSAIPVVDRAGIMRGIVTADDALEVLQEEASEDAYLLAGASSTSSATESLHLKVLHRGPMLFVTVLGGMVMARVLDVFLGGESPQSADEDPWEPFVPYIPLVLGMVATVGQQTSAVAVRGIAMGQLGPGRRASFFAGEIQIGAALGLLSALVVGPLAAFFSNDPEVGLSLGGALFIAMTWTTTAACSVAMGSHVVGLDPALVSGPVMTAVSDLSAVLVFLSIASLFLQAT